MKQLGLICEPPILGTSFKEFNSSHHNGDIYPVAGVLHMTMYLKFLNSGEAFLAVRGAPVISRVCCCPRPHIGGEAAAMPWGGPAQVLFCPWLRIGSFLFGPRFGMILGKMAYDQKFWDRHASQ